MLAAKISAHNLALAARDTQNDVARAAHLNAAHTAARGMRVALTEAGHGSFKNWYGSDRLFDVKARIKSIMELRPQK